MIFKQWEDVLSGKKTQTRRPYNPQHFAMLNGHELPSGYIETGAGVDIVKTEDCGKDHRDVTKWRVGQTYAVQPKMSKPSVGRILLTGIRLERLQDISEEDAKAERADNLDWSNVTSKSAKIRYRSYREGYQELWNDCYGKDPDLRWDANPWVWVLTFEVVEGEA